MLRRWCVHYKSVRPCNRILSIRLAIDGKGQLLRAWRQFYVSVQRSSSLSNLQGPLTASLQCQKTRLEHVDQVCTCLQFIPGRCIVKWLMVWKLSQRKASMHVAMDRVSEDRFDVSATYWCHIGLAVWAIWCWDNGFRDNAIDDDQLSSMILASLPLCTSLLSLLSVSSLFPGLFVLYNPSSN